MPNCPFSADRVVVRSTPVTCGHNFIPEYALEFSRTRLAPTKTVKFHCSTVRHLLGRCGQPSFPAHRGNFAYSSASRSKSMSRSGPSRCSPTDELLRSRNHGLAFRRVLFSFGSFHALKFICHHPWHFVIRQAAVAEGNGQQSNLGRRIFSHARQAGGVLPMPKTAA